MDLGASHREDEEFNRANRLLVAAVKGESVTPVTPEAKQLFEIVKRFYALAPASAWELLVSREPRLVDLESETRRGAFTRAIPVIGKRNSPQLQQIARELAKHAAAEMYSTGGIQRQIATARGITTLDLNRLAETDPEVQKALDLLPQAKQLADNAKKTIAQRNNARLTAQQSETSPASTR